MFGIASRPAPRPTSLERAMVALLRERAFSGTIKAADLVADDRAASEIVARADQTIGTTGTSGWASQIVQDSLGEFLASLAPLSAAARLIAAGLRVNLKPGASTTFPARNGTPTATAGWIGEGEPINVKSFSLTDSCELAPRKFALITVFTRELAKRGDGERILSAMLREEAAAQLDHAYFSATASSASDHAGLLAGLTAIGGWAGGDIEALRTDLMAISDTVSAAGSGSLIYVASPARAARVALIAPELQVPVLPSLGVAADVLIGVDPANLVHGTSPEFEITASTEAILHMSDEALEIVAGTPTTADPVRSLWQTDGIALRLIGEVAFDARKSDAIAYVSNCTW